ncbi:MAG TPA: RES family NAD+ phosphorylase [Ramlibacter sp.]|jgi:RES domain-containing protein|nr:RES family NAD+ phosphorylase [Ramlibacter sp.]
MILWRIAAETRQYKANDLSGGGAARSPGRWNEAGQAVLYAAPTIAIAVLETAAHIDDGGFPLNRYLVRIDVPTAVWKKRRELDVAGLPLTWDAIPAGATSAQIGAAWIKSRGSAVLIVPSVIVPEEQAALVNPAHPDIAKISATVLRPFEYNKLFRRG